MLMLGEKKRKSRSEGGQVHVSVIARNNWEERKTSDEYRRKKMGGEEEGKRA